MTQIKKYLQKYRVHYGISANIHKGIMFNQAALTPGADPDYHAITGILDPYPGYCSSYMKLIKIAYGILECI